MPELEKDLGIEVYATKGLGVGGNIRATIDDFSVEEVLVDGSRAFTNGTISSKVLGSTLEKRKYLLCVLVKRNWDTFVAIKNIAKQLGIDQNRVQIAGIKDAKAVTAQHLTIEDELIEEVSKVGIKDIQLLPEGYIREALSTYYLLGNHFRIVAKNLENNSTAEIRTSQTIQELQIAGGIPNFFGHQRFGTTRPITHLVGREIVNGNFEKAAMLFLAESCVNEHPASKQARQELQSSGDLKRALKNFPKQLRFEKLMLTHLVDNSEDFVGAFRRLPIKLQELFVQAHQSYIFNRFLSRRLKHGYFLNSAVGGDFVVCVERNGLPLTRMTKNVTDETITDINEQINLGKMRVALPLIGLGQKLSKGVMGDLEKEVLEQEGIELENLRANIFLKRCTKGGLRPIVAPIKDFKLENTVEKTCNGEKFIALSFMLLRGSYATILLREIMKPSNPVTAGF